MTNTKEVVGGIIGTSVSAVGTGLQTNELLQTISLVLTIVGTCITIAMAIINWWKKAKEDGKITKDEIKDGVDIIVDGVKTIQDITKDKEDKK